MIHNPLPVTNRQTLTCLCPKLQHHEALKADSIWTPTRPLSEYFYHILQLQETFSRKWLFNGRKMLFLLLLLLLLLGDSDDSQ